MCFKMGKMISLWENVQAIIVLKQNVNTGNTLDLDM